MIHIDFNPNHPQKETKYDISPEEWQKWQNMVDQAKFSTKAIIDEWERLSIEEKKSSTPALTSRQINRYSTNWKEMRKWLAKNVFHGKCAFCELETDLEAPGTAEHFRPKKFELDKQSLIYSTDENGEEILHPGYFWLAYDWKNILPTCQFCNSKKQSQFPIENHNLIVVQGNFSEFKVNSNPAYCYPSVDYLDEVECPILINPSKEDPTKYLAFGVDGSVVPLKGENWNKGDQTIKIFGLDRENLKNKRRTAQEEAVEKYLTAILKEKREAFQEKVRKGRIPLSAAILTRLKAETRKWLF